VDEDVRTDPNRKCASGGYIDQGGGVVTLAIRQIIVEYVDLKSLAKLQQTGIALTRGS
jgi:hypothetical protein